MIAKFFDHFEEILGSILVAVMVTISFVNVITRYFIRMSLSWSEEITVNLFVWVVMLGTAIAFKKGSHLGMEFIYERFPDRIKKVLFLLSAILSIAFFVVLGWLGAIEVKDEIDLCVITESLAIPVWYYTIAIPVFSVLVIFRILQNVVTSLRDHSY
ncbi:MULTISPECIES: TRAP transporter small permease [Dethiosulfovibrio]|uniref:Tripartite ATP-independent periplasmic transporter DctQ component n=3 Tax=Dethiosulfovibrio TaxID=47054 RepID=D2Z4Y8_9BACT|nr:MULTISPECIES: TRAP transporter small permease [Dethiosulfovibrio]MEA3284170.1 TRAP transporter small permease [Synergistota bacterium]EFC90547.1 Tripartite ATP-independent periplasmic transporter DctQ component [Dethiosulfovibrio peptidovorans DSM 11002]MCF4115070.1 TRAP transporter small permease [Dethiosulfovibrio russensis]MCF4143488.1 TRAP transporter small permease [Dethiosulfovibrio marinus]MCF4145697.1 TRAP transporter small permease [Dethiosulfovibrio acidaminovorans]